MEVLKGLTLVTFSLGDVFEEYQAGCLSWPIVESHLKSFEGLEQFSVKSLWTGSQYTLVGSDGAIKACLNRLLSVLSDLIEELKRLLEKVQNASSVEGGQSILYNFFKINNASRFSCFDYEDAGNLYRGIGQLEVWSNKLKELCESI